MREKTPFLVAVCVLSLSLVGCSGVDDDNDAKKSDSKASSDSSSTKGAGTKTSPEDLPKVPALKKGYDGAFKDVKFGKCPTENGMVEVSADVTNSTKRAQDYVIVVSWINGSNDVLGRAVGKVEGLGAKKSASVVLSTTLDAPAEVSCTYNVTRGSLKG